MTIQERMRATLERTGLPYKEIEVYGSQIVITSWCKDSAEKWAILLVKFAKVRGIRESIDYTKENKNTVLRPTTVKVFRTFAAVINDDRSYDTGMAKEITI